MKRYKIFLYIFFSLLVTGSAFFLLFNMIRWQNELALNEKQKEEQEILDGVGRGYQRFTEEIAVLRFLFSTNQEDSFFMKDNFSYINEEFSEQWDTWQLLAVAPEILESVIWFPFSSGSAQGYLYDSATRSFILTEETLDMYSENLFERTLFESNHSPVWDIGVSGGTGASKLVLRLNNDELYHKVLLPLLKEELVDYTFSLESLESQNVESEGKGIPDITLELISPNTMPRWERGSEPFYISLWKNRFQGKELFDNRERPEEQPEFRLDIYSKEDSLKIRVERARQINILISGGILILLLILYYLLSILLFRTARLRKEEQSFVAQMSHELRTPISVVASSAQNLKEGIVVNPGRIRQYGTVLLDESERLNRTIDSILLYAGIENRKTRMAPVNCNPSVILQDILGRLEFRIRESGLRLEVKDTSAPKQFFGQPEDIKTVMENLILNALKHGISEKGVVRIELKKRYPSGMIFKVEDFGIGIPKREQRRIFEPFFRGQSSKEKMVKGNGLGLHIVKKMVEANKGKIRLESPVEEISGEKHSGCLFSAEFSENN